MRVRGFGSLCLAVHSSVFMALPGSSRSIQLAFWISRRRPGFPLGFRQTPGCCKALLIHSPSDAAVGGVVNNPHSPAWFASWAVLLVGVRVALRIARPQWSSQPRPRRKIHARSATFILHP